MTVAPEMDEQSLFRYLCSASHWQFFILSKCMPQPDGSYLYNISYLLFYLKLLIFLHFRCIPSLCSASHSSVPVLFSFSYHSPHTCSCSRYSCQMVQFHYSNFLCFCLFYFGSFLVHMIYRTVYRTMTFVCYPTVLLPHYVLLLLD